MDELIFWVYLQQALGFANRSLFAVLDAFGSARGFYEASAAEKKACGLFRPGQLQKIQNVDINVCAKIVEKCARLGYDMITPDSDAYPIRLRHIPDPPAVLYVSGTLGDLDDEAAVAVVGTRKCADSSRAAVFELCTRLAQAGAVIVSGGALGIDTSALQGALNGGGKPIAVLGCGLDYPYLPENEALRRDIAKTGALVSEYPPGYPSAPQNFPVRNRIMSGLSLGVIVAEAGPRSGALITAKHALEQGRDVFALPGDPPGGRCAGGDALLRDGAKPVLSPADVLEEYAALYPHRLDLGGSEIPLARSAAQAPALNGAVRASDSRKPRGKSGGGAQTANDQRPSVQTASEPFRLPDMPDGLSEAAGKLYRCIGAPVMGADALVEQSGLSEAAAIAALTELELMGIIAALPGGRYAFCL